MRRMALAILTVLMLSACGSTIITKTDPDTGICYEHVRQWIIWQIENDIYRVNPDQCKP